MSQLPKGWRKRRPPLATDEIVAYNFGGNLHDVGAELADLLGWDWSEPVMQARPGERIARRRLGPARFSEWAVRGWLDRARAAVK